ncbi:ribosome-associated molecular chaperone SSB1-like [Thrips palmi]|uniref:Ribosome-associated molecular chaperone SSB1-like n=1 Tax=Thrips palmi TaxID=161013 RepID=A0A6P8YJ84_THRPL|nr:ribosome-associated molecular chaperone SSB1-like [Thrips palmi]
MKRCQDMARQGSAPEVVLGIDLGTTKSVMAAFLEDDVEVLQNDIGSRSTPSCVHASMDAGDAVRDVGEAALRLAVSHPHSTVRNVKSVLGRAHQDVGSDHHLGPIKLGQSNLGHGVSIYLEGGVVMAAEEVTSMLLVHLKKAAEEQLGRGDINFAVIAVPAYFNAAQRNAVRDAAYLAGLRVLHLVNDTSAAALVYARERDQPKTVLVVDVGGGGSSVAVVRTEFSAVRVLAASDRRLPGGEDFDARMVEHFKEVIKQAHGLEVTSARSLEILRGQWEKAKQKLSRIPSTKMATFLPDGDLDFQADVSRAAFEELCRPLFEAIVDEVKRTLLKAEVAVNQVDDVVLVGGSSRIPALRAMVQSELAQRPLCKAVSADEAVAKGAALLAAQCVRLEEVTPLVLKVTAAGNEVVVPANTALPLTLAMPGNSTVVVEQGCLDQPSLVVIHEKKSVQAVKFSIDPCGFFRFLDSQGASMKLLPRGCIGGPALTQIRDKVQSRIQDEEEDRRRIELKNELEERCRAYLSQEEEAAQGDPDEALVRDLRRDCETHLQWLEANPTAAKEELDTRHASLTGCWLNLDESREQRRAANAREAERQRVESETFKMRKNLEEKCLSYLQEPEAAYGDPDADLVRNLRRECGRHLQLLDADHDFSLDELELKHASVSSLWSELKESRERREAQREEAERLQREREREALRRQREDEIRRQREAERMQRDDEIRRQREAERMQREDEIRRQREAERGQKEAERRQREDEKQWAAIKRSEELRNQKEGDMKKEADRRPRQAQTYSQVAQKRPAAGRSDQGAGDEAGPRDPRVALEDSVRQMYKCVFRSEALRRKSFSLQPQDPRPSPRLPATRVVRALADGEAVRALQAAATAGRALLVVEQVAAPGRLLVALSARFLAGHGARKPVERLLLLRDALTTTGEDLLLRLDGLLADAGVQVACAEHTLFSMYSHCKKSTQMSTLQQERA